MKPSRSIVWLVGGLSLAWATFAGEPPKPATHVLTVAADRPDALYRRGERVTFLARVTHGGKPIESGEIAWGLSKDGVEPRSTGRAQVSGGSATITGALEEPGFLHCSVTFTTAEGKVTSLAAAAVSPLEIRPSQPVPDDFVAFWEGKKRQLAGVPLNPRLTAVKSPRDGIATFDVQVDSLGAPVSGYFARPAKATSRSLPVILTVHGAGVTSSQLNGAASWANQGALAMDMNAHGLPNGREKEFYEALAAGELKNYRRAGRESRETIYFLGMFLRLVRALDFLTAQPEWDGRTVVVSGSSQGGAQAIAAAGLDARVTFFAAGVPAMCDHTGALAGRIAGWPKFIETRETAPPPEVVTAVRYYDAVNFAAQARAPGFFTVGFIDTTCPPTSVYAAYNALRTKKEIHHDVAAGHTNTPAASAAMRAAVMKHLEMQKHSGKARE
jgi:cephalosporin-C deacetylase